LRESSESPEKTRNRSQFLFQLFARFEAASGKKIDSEGTTRREALVNELHLCRYSEREAEIAEQWILKGDPVRYGSLTLADFFPWKNLKPEQLASIGYDISPVIKSAERAAEQKGYDAGYSEARRTIQPMKQSGPILTPLSDSERMEFEVLKGKVPDLEELNQRLTEKLRKIESNKRRKPMEAFNHG
jgi:hypothetical protein